MRFRLSVAYSIIVFGITAMPLLASTAVLVVPATAAHGARVAIAGTGLDEPGLTATFSATQGTAAATIASRAPALLEVIVPTTAVTGTIVIATPTTTIATLQFTVSNDPSYGSVATLAGRPAGSDDASDGDNGISQLRRPSGIAVGPNGDLFVADASLHEIRRITRSGTVTVFAGSGQRGYREGVGRAAQFTAPQGLAYDAAADVLYVADTGNRVIRAITANGTTSLFAGRAPQIH